MSSLQDGRACDGRQMERLRRRERREHRGWRRLLTATLVWSATMAGGLGILFMVSYPEDLAWREAAGIPEASTISLQDSEPIWPGLTVWALLVGLATLLAWRAARAS